MKKRFLALFLVVSLILSMGMTSFAFAAESTSNSPLVPGVKVEADKNSATGYTVTFTFEDGDAQSVQLDIGARFYEAGGTPGVVPDTYYSPFEWEDGMFGVGYEGYIIDLEKVEGTDLWTIALPLPHALFQYNYVVDGAPANDPTNPWMENPNENGGADGDCTVYVPLDPEKQPSAIDFGYLDTETVTQPGLLSYVSYTDVNGNVAPLGIYVPYGYDANRVEPYKVLYVSHGGGANEVNWYGCGRMNVEFDHLIADGKVEPTIVVTMNNTVYSWNYDVIIDNLMNRILPYMEANYNVDKHASGRAFAGLSMGGMTTSHVLYERPDDFGYFGIFSGCDNEVDFTTLDIDAMKNSVIMLGGGCYDFGTTGTQASREYFYISNLAKTFDEHGIAYGWEVVDGGHDWYTWPQLMRIFAEDYLWTKNTDLESGVRVEEDVDSATGYTVTFTFEDAAAQNVQLDIGARFYTTDEGLGDVPETYYSPYEWQDGMFGVGYEGYIIDLEKVPGTDLWTISMPLPHALFQYNYIVDGVETNDPTNPWGENPNENGGADGDCTVYVPLNPEKQPSAIDFTYLDPETVTRPGQLTYVSYTDINGDSAPLGVYLPYGYDANRAEPYKVLYVSHGSGASEVNWYGCGRMNVEFDHLIEDGRVEPTIVVTMNNTWYAWDMDVIIDNLMNHILPYMEENYNVSKDASHRAFAGLSAGGRTTFNVLYNCMDAFEYFGIFSSVDAGLDFSASDVSRLKKVGILFGIGYYDGDTRHANMNAKLEHFDELGVSYGHEIVRGGHDWYTWPELMRIFAEEYLWKNEDAIKLSTDAFHVKPDGYANITTEFTEVVNSNTAILNYTFDTDLFEYADFHPEKGVGVISKESTANGAKVVVMISDYNTQTYGRLAIHAKADAALTRGWATVKAQVEYVVKDENGDKTIETATGSVKFTTGGLLVEGDTNDDGIVDLIDLSNMVDWFGLDNSHPDWDTWYTFFDFNDNKEIDIYDIVYVAQRIQ